MLLENSRLLESHPSLRLRKLVLRATEKTIFTSLGRIKKDSLVKGLNNPGLVIVIGRGHSGTRAIASVLRDSGYFIGKHLNQALDLLPPDTMYRAARLPGRLVKSLGRGSWDVSALHTGDIDDAFLFYLAIYLRAVTGHGGLHKGWKLPETTLSYPWLTRLFPEARYIFWVRDPRDSILKAHNTDQLWEWNVEGGRGVDILEARALSWKYQWDLVARSPKPKHFLMVKFEDFVLSQHDTLLKLEDFLQCNLRPIKTNRARVGVWEKQERLSQYDFLEEPLRQLNYVG